MAFDYKKEQKAYYAPTKRPELIEIPEMRFLAVRGKGNPNDLNGEYNKAVSMLYSIAYTIRMSYKGEHQIPDFFEYVVPPLEGFWWQEQINGVDYAHKENFYWISLIRVPEFVTQKELEWAKEAVLLKKKQDCSLVELYQYHEGLCVQCMHTGPFDEEPETVRNMEQYAHEQGYEIEINEERFHHEIYLSDPRKCAPLKQKTILRHPVRKA